MADELTPTHVTVRLLELPVRAALAAAHDRAPEERRDLVIIALHLDDDPSTPRGWGECSALNRPGYTSEWSRDAFERLSSDRPLDQQQHPMAAAAVEMAQLDLTLRAQGQSLAEHLGTGGGSSTAGAVVGLGQLDSKLDEVASLVAEGYQRIKCKITPDECGSHIEAIRARFPDIELHVDANGSFTQTEMTQLRSLADLGVTAIEQPFAIGDVAAAADLVEATGMTVIADESVSTVADLERIAVAGAAGAVTIKPPKLGGLSAARAALIQVTELGLAAVIGGMLEGGLGRHQLAALAPHPAFSLVGDLTPARRWLADDPFDDIELVDGRIAAPSTLGVAGDPDPEILDRYTVAKATIPFTR